jgi:hypothetical protein
VVIMTLLDCTVFVIENNKVVENFETDADLCQVRTFFVRKH